MPPRSYVTAIDPPAASSEAHPLSSTRRGQRVRLEAIEGGRRLTMRLISMGLPPGSEVEVLHNRRGAVVVAREHNRIGIGAGMAARIRVQPLP